ncbi:hypothetical protein IJJ02_02605 [Candidatus Saccharibacteria bacterium]|nr:hypothetical protein [Candidatus Saccharibacteria bacterium]
MSKRRIGSFLLFAVVAIVGIVLWSSQNASAYYAKNDYGDYCYAIQYEGITDHESAQTSEIRGDVFSTKRLCFDSKGGLYTDERPANASSTYSRPKFDILTARSVRVTYCNKGAMLPHSVACVNNTKKDFDLDSYGGNFKTMAQAINDEIAANGALATLNYTGTTETLVALDDNNASRDRAKEQYDETTAENIEEQIEARAQNSACYDASGHLGWIFCPLIQGIGDAMGDLYDGIIQPFLVIEPELVSGDGTYLAWDIFRNFANIAFVILFLVVIFSQLTGVGIDNYGIKRMLPKLIVAAILINLSYVICQLAVDLSNILGSSLESLFINIAKQIDSNAASPADYFSGLVSTAGTAIGIVGLGGEALVTLAPLAAMGFAAIIPILLGLLSAIVSVLFMFVILFVRKAIAILLVAVAPLAFVSYIMPNTKKLLFDKWLNIFKGVLTVYPLAGMLVGGGVLASSIIVAAAANQAASGDADLGTFLLYMGALLIQVVPFFFLPKLFRGSLSAVGNLGNAIADRGRRFSNRARGAVEGSERVQDWQNRQKENAALGRANRTLNRLQGRADRGELTAGQRRRFARATNIKDRIGQQRSNENLIAAETEYANKGQNDIMDDWNKAFDNNDADKLDMLTNLLNKRYGAAAASDIGKALEGKNIVENANHRSSLNTLRRTMANNSDFAGNMRNKSSDAFQMIGNGGMDKGGTLQNLSHFSKNNGICTSAKDWATQSAATLDRAIKAGKLDEEMIKNLLNSTAPDIQSGIQTDKDKVEVLRRGLSSMGASGGGSGGGVGTIQPVVEERDSGLIITHGIK